MYFKARTEHHPFPLLHTDNPNLCSLPLKSLDRSAAMAAWLGGSYWNFWEQQSFTGGMRSLFSPFLTSALNYLCVNSMQKPLTFKPPVCKLTFRLHWPGRQAAVGNVPPTKSTPASLSPLHGVGVVTAFVWHWGVWHVSCCAPATRPGCKWSCFGMSNTFPKELVAQLVSGPLQLNIWNEVCGEDWTVRWLCSTLRAPFADISAVQVRGLHA